MTVPPSFTTVNRHNLGTLSLAIKHSISQATFISLDTEFTGLGDPKLTRAKDIEDRYINLSVVAKSHAIIAFGMSIYTRTRKIRPNTPCPISISQ
jgi:target of EGR1 protein 1